MPQANTVLPVSFYSFIHSPNKLSLGIYDILGPVLNPGRMLFQQS